MSCAELSVRPVMARSLPFGLYILFIAIGGWLLSSSFAAGLGSLDMRSLYAIKIAFVAVALLAYRNDYRELSWQHPDSVSHWAVAAIVGFAVFVIWIGLDFGWTRVGAPKAGFVPVDDQGNLMLPLVGMRIFGAAVVVPVMEELFWRSFVQRWIDRQDFLSLLPSQTSWRALLLTSVAFGLEHDQWLAGVIAGLAYGWLYRRTNNLWMPIVAHGLTNLLLGLWVVAYGQWQYW